MQQCVMFPVTHKKSELAHFPKQTIKSVATNYFVIITKYPLHQASHDINPSQIDILEHQYVN